MITHVDKIEQKCHENLDQSLNDSINSSTVFGGMNVYELQIKFFSWLVLEHQIQFKHI